MVSQRWYTNSDECYSLLEVNKHANYIAADLYGCGTTDL